MYFLEKKMKILCKTEGSKLKPTYVYVFFYSRCIPLWTYRYANPTPMSTFEIHEVTTDASLLTRKSPTTQSTTPIDPGINPKKYKHTYQVEDLNSSGQVPPHRPIYHAEILSWRDTMSLFCSTLAKIFLTQTLILDIWFWMSKTGIDAWNELVGEALCISTLAPELDRGRWGQSRW
jgi:hypothetical protein